MSARYELSQGTLSPRIYSCLVVAIVFCSAGARVEASCGDHLHRSMNNTGTSQFQAPIQSGLTDLSPRRAPCTGNHCQPAPPVRFPVPPAEISSATDERGILGSVPALVPLVGRRKQNPGNARVAFEDHRVNLDRPPQVSGND